MKKSFLVLKVYKKLCCAYVGISNYNIIQDAASWVTTNINSFYKNQTKSYIYLVLSIKTRTKSFYNPVFYNPCLITSLLISDYHILPNLTWSQVQVNQTAEHLECLTLGMLYLDCAHIQIDPCESTLYLPLKTIFLRRLWHGSWVQNDCILTDQN